MTERVIRDSSILPAPVSCYSYVAPIFVEHTYLAYMTLMPLANGFSRADTYMIFVAAADLGVAWTYAGYTGQFPSCDDTVMSDNSIVT